MISKEQLTDIFFDLDHTLWDFEKNSALTFDFIFKELHLSIDLKDFLNHYNPINHYYWKLYRENKISQEELRFNRLAKTFETLKFDIAHPPINQIAALYIEKLSTFTHVFEGAHELLQNLSATLDSDAGGAYSKQREVSKVLLVVITSNRGLCGGFNSSVIKEVTQNILSNYQDVDVDLLTIGKKGNDILSKSYPVIDARNDIFDNLTFDNVAEVAEKIMDLYVNGTYDKIEIIYNRFKK